MRGMNDLRRLCLTMGTVVTVACAGTEMPTAPAAPPTPAPSRADQSFLAIGYACGFGTEPDRRYSVHEIDPATGTFRSTVISSGSGVWAVMLSFGPHRADGRLLYTSRYPSGNRPAETVYVHRLDATGALHAVGELPLTAGRWYGGARIDNAGRFLVANSVVVQPDFTPVDPRLSVHLLDASGVPRAASGNLSDLRSIVDFVLAPNGRHVFTGSTLTPPLAAYAVQADSGAIQQVAGSPFDGAGRGSFALALHPAGRFLYTADYQTDRTHRAVWLHHVDGTTGEIRYVDGFPGDVAGYMTVDPSGRYLYLATWTGQIWGYAIDQGFGGLTVLPGFPMTAAWEVANSVTTDATGRYLYVTGQPARGGRTPANSPVYGYRIDPATGAIAALPGFPVNPTSDTCPAIVTASR